ncbi:hypothetical protein D3C72_1223680 [compost metagenome]
MRRFDHAARHFAQVLFHQARQVGDGGKRQRHGSCQRADRRARDDACKRRQGDEQDDEREAAHGVHQPAEDHRQRTVFQRLVFRHEEQQDAQRAADQDGGREANAQHGHGLAQRHPDFRQQVDDVIDRFFKHVLHPSMRWLQTPRCRNKRARVPAPSCAGWPCRSDRIVRRWRLFPRRRRGCRWRPAPTAHG